MGCPQHETSPSVPFTTMISVSHCAQRNLVPAAVAMSRRIPNDAYMSASRDGRGPRGGPRRFGSGAQAGRPVASPGVETGGAADVVEPEVVRRARGAADRRTRLGRDGPPLLLLHPNGFCAGVFDPLAQRLRGDYRVLGIDVRGHGLSDAPSSTRPSARSPLAAGDVVAMLDASGSTRCSIARRVARRRGHRDPGRPAASRHCASALLCEAIAIAVPDRPARGSVLPGAGTARTHGRGRPASARAVWADRATVRASYGRRPPLDVHGAGGARRVRAMGFPRPARRPGRAVVPARGRGLVLRVRRPTPTARRRAFAHLPSFSAPAHHRVRRRHRPPGRACSTRAGRRAGRASS